MTFRSKQHRRRRPGTFKLTGDLTIRGVTKEVTFDVEGPDPAVKDPWGNVRAGVEATAKINRKDFGLVWNALIEGGGVVVGDEVSITIEAELVQKSAAPAGRLIATRRPDRCAWRALEMAGWTCSSGHSCSRCIASVAEREQVKAYDHGKTGGDKNTDSRICSDAAGARGLFPTRPVERDKLLSVLEAARWAPSSRNEQPWAYLLAAQGRCSEF